MLDFKEVILSGRWFWTEKERSFLFDSTEEDY